MHHYLMSGLDNVYLKNGYTIVTDEEHGECISITNAETLHKCIVKTLVRVERRLTTNEIHFLRKALNMSTFDMYEVLGSTFGIVPHMTPTEECVLRLYASEKLLRIQQSPSKTMQAMMSRKPNTNMYFELKTIWKRTNESSCV